MLKADGCSGFMGHMLFCYQLGKKTGRRASKGAMGMIKCFAVCRETLMSENPHMDLNKNIKELQRQALLCHLGVGCLRHWPQVFQG